MKFVLQCLFFRKIMHKSLAEFGYAILIRAEHFQFGSVLDQNKQLNRFFFSFWIEPKTGSNRLISVRFFPLSNRTAMPRCHPLRINNVVLVVTTSCKGKNNCKKTVSVLSNHCFDFYGHSSASRSEIIPLWQSRWDLFMSWPMKENQVNQWKNHQQFISDMASLRDERQKASKIGREEDKFYSNAERKY